MAETKKIEKNAVFGLWDEIKKNALGISDKTQAFDGFYVSFLAAGEPVNKEDVQFPWKLGHSPGGTPIGTGTTAPVDMNSLSSLRTVCEYADKRLQFKGDNLCDDIGSSLSNAYRMIINSASSKPIVIPIPAELQIQLDAANKLLINTEGGKSPTKLKYEEYRDAWQKSRIEYSKAYSAAMKDPISLASWPNDGSSYFEKVTDAINDWEIYGSMSKVDAAIALIAAQGTDAATEFIASAKKMIDPDGVYSIDVGGGARVLYTEIFPSNWADPDADGWTGYSFNSAESNEDYTDDSTSYGGGAGINLGFWSVSGGGSHSEAEQKHELSSDKLFISFEYAIADITRPWMDTLLFRMNDWYLPGQKAKAISDSTEVQLKRIIKDVDDKFWLPTVTSKLILVRNLFIRNDNFYEAYLASQKSTNAGGSFGWGPFSINANYKTQSSRVKIEDDGEGSGLRVKGVQLIGFISEIIPSSPKIDGPV